MFGIVLQDDNKEKRKL